MKPLLVGAALAAALPASAPLRAAEHTTPAVIEMTASRYRFEPDRIEVVEGEDVVIRVHSSDTTHGFGIPAYKVKVTIPKGGEAVAVRFKATRAGTFPFECSEYCGSGHRGMRGTLIVQGKAQ